MTTPTKEIQRLDNFLRLYGSGTGTLTRVVGTTSQTSYSVTVRYHMRGYKPDELNEMIIQGDSRVIISPSEITAQGWPGAPPPNDSPFPRRGDKFTTVQGKIINVEANEPIHLEDVWVRDNMQVRG